MESFHLHSVTQRLVAHKDLNPSQVPVPPIDAGRQGPDDAGQPRRPPRRSAGLPGRLRRPPGQDLRPGATPRPASNRSPSWSPRSWPRSRTHAPTACSGWSTTARPTGERRPSTGSPNSPPPRSWCTPRSTRPGSNVSRSTSSSSSEKRCPPTTSPTSTQSSSALAGFEVRFNTAAKPLNWKLTTNDLADRLEKLDRHQEAQTTNGAQPAAA